MPNIYFTPTMYDYLESMGRLPANSIRVELIPKTMPVANGDGNIVSVRMADGSKKTPEEVYGVNAA